MSPPEDFLNGILDAQIPCRKVTLASVRRRQQGRFLPPLPETVFSRLAPLPGKALAVYMVLLQLARLGKAESVTLTTTYLARFGIGRHEKADALRNLEAAGLITVDRRCRKNPIITLIEDPPQEPGD